LYIVCYFVSSIVLPIVLFGLTTTKLNKLYYYDYSDVAHRSPTKLCTMFGRLLRAGTLYLHFRGRLLPDGILPGAKFTLCQSLAFSYIGRVTARHLS